MPPAIFSSAWRRRLRYRRLLNPKPQSDTCASVNDARSVALVKRDNIGDFILATTFLETAYDKWADKDIAYVCKPELRDIAAAFYPKWSVLAPPESKRDYRFFSKKHLRAEVMKWPARDWMISLRAMRRPSEAVFESWIPARRKVAISNQYAKYEPRLLEEMPDENSIYNEVLQYSPAGEEEVCADIMNHRFLLDRCFPGNALHNKNALPLIPARVLNDEALHNKAREKGGLNGFERFLAVCPFATQSVRMYPLDKLAPAVSNAAITHNMPVVIFGADSDMDEANRLAALLSPGINTISLAGQLTMLETISCIARADAAISVDSACAHIAIASGVPTVVMLGGGHYGHFGPWGPLKKTRWLTHAMECFDCSWNCVHSRPHCITDIASQSVADALEGMIKCKIA